MAFSTCSLSRLALTTGCDPRFAKRRTLSRELPLRPLSNGNWQPTGSPVQNALIQTDGLKTFGSKQLYSLVRKHTVRPTAVGHDLLAFRELGQASFQLLNRHRQSTRDVSSAVLFRWTNIQHDHLALSRRA